MAQRPAPGTVLAAVVVVVDDIVVVEELLVVVVEVVTPLDPLLSLITASTFVPVVSSCANRANFI